MIVTMKGDRDADTHAGRQEQVVMRRHVTPCDRRSEPLRWIDASPPEPVRHNRPRPAESGLGPKMSASVRRRGRPAAGYWLRHWMRQVIGFTVEPHTSASLFPVILQAFDKEVVRVDVSTWRNETSTHEKQVQRSLRQMLAPPT